MNTVRVCGKNKLCGKISVQGCKNSVLPIIAASLLNGGVNIIHNCPMLTDVFTSVAILECLGCRAEFYNNTLIINSSNLNNNTIPRHLMSALRSSVIFLGPVLSRIGLMNISMPGGCHIGARPIDFHLNAFERMGVEVLCLEDSVNCRVNKLSGVDIFLPLPSVGATENIMLLAAMGEGVTTIYNAAKEPEIIDLQNYINSMGGRIFGAGTSKITIYAVKKLNSGIYTVMPDRIEAATLACAVTAAGGDVLIENIEPRHIECVLSTLQKSGASIIKYRDSLRVISKGEPKNFGLVSTRPYPGFPTDVQSVIMSLMSTSKGCGEIYENIFENRFAHGAELNKMGADVKINGNHAIVNGRRLHGATTNARDLRCGAALVVAGLCAEGETIVKNAQHIDRGHENFEARLSSIGAKVERVREENEEKLP